MKKMKRQLENEYRYNKKFQECVDEYCRQYGCTREEALKQEVIKQACLCCTEV